MYPSNLLRESPRSPFRGLASATVLATWICLASAGMSVLWSYSSRPGTPAHAEQRIPGDSAVRSGKGKFSLIVFAHPRCPCTEATIEELNRLMAGYSDRLSLTVFFFSPSDRPSSWAHTSLWRAARRIPGARVVADVDGGETTRFGVSTSGQALLYDPAGRLVFQGGVTPGRGHYGDNLGSSAIAALVRGDFPSSGETPVFGCPILSGRDDESTREECHP